MEANSSPETYYNKGVKEYEEGQYDLAIENFKKAVDLDESSFDYCFNLGIAYMATEQYDLAVEVFNKAIEINSNDIDLYTNLGLAFYSKGDYEKAAKAYKKTIWLNSTDPETFNNTGLAYCALKNYKEAASNFKHAVRIEPKDQNYNFNFALACYGAEKYELAEEHLVKVINYNKQRDDGYLLLGKVYIKQGIYDLAKDSFEKLLLINPDDEEAPIYIEKINSRRPGESIEIIGEEKASEQDDEEVKKVKKTEKPKKETIDNEKQAKIKNYLDSAQKLLEQKRYKDAVLEYKKVLEIKQDHQDAIKNINFAKGKLLQTKELYEKGLSHFENNEFSEAINCLKEAQFLNPHSKRVRDLMNQVVAKTKVTT